MWLCVGGGEFLPNDSVQVLDGCKMRAIIKPTLNLGGMQMAYYQSRQCEVILFDDSTDWQLVEREMATCKHYCLSPLHDRDIRQDGEPVKPHRHLYLVFDNPRSFQAIARQFQIGEQLINKIKGTIQGCYIYAYHGDSPYKALYDQGGIKADNVGWWKSTKREVQTTDWTVEYFRLLRDGLTSEQFLALSEKYGRDFVFNSGKVYGAYQFYAHLKKYEDMERDGARLLQEIQEFDKAHPLTSDGLGDGLDGEQSHKILQ